MNLQLDHFSDEPKPKKNARAFPRKGASHTNTNLPPLNRVCETHHAIEHGSNNVSRWMTWLPISLKNAAKCDKWYQLQNHSITESLNAKGAWEKLFTSHPRACRISVSNNKKRSPLCVRTLREQCLFTKKTILLESPAPG